MHSFLLEKKKKEPHVCVTCNTIITVKHVSIECADLVEVEVRKKYFEEIFVFTVQNVDPEKIFSYLTEKLVFSVRDEVC